MKPLIVVVGLLSMLMSMISSASTNSLVVSTYPLYLITQEITYGIEKPQLLLENQTGHDIQLTPAHRKKLQDASLILWIGKEHEAPLANTLKEHKAAVSILESGIINRLPQRNVKGQVMQNTVDTHVWLDPHHAVRIGFFIAVLRGQQFPQHKTRYWANAQKFANELFKTAQNYKSSGTARPYWAYHDAYQYLESSLNLKFSGAMTADPHTTPTITQLKYLTEHRPQKTMCLLAEGYAQNKHYQLLEPVVFKSVDERMQGEVHFVTAWKTLVQQIQQCLIQARS